MGVIPDRNLCLICLLCKQCHSGGYNQKRAFLCKHYWQSWYTQFVVAVFSSSKEREFRFTVMILQDHQLCTCLIPMAMFCCFSVSHYSGGIFYEAPTLDKSHRLVLRGAPIVLFVCSRLLLRLGQRNVTARVTVILTISRIPWVRSTVHYRVSWWWTTKIYPSKVH